ncbi:maleylpyruvate isomerase family mycothiol-dependent enzyme [Rhodococcus sp. Eu-32]|uniref:maleylpyruvate isomerase family mycothiol-dependent enzyme n=1 Tax=Rhodococcus sp. Eu-32 TaxID=1017319 RepID=UPI000DF27437|nr:maleylpyruvate isomerase family mycothiol-dependent enzyme [Rhodococcus sp. Eu-32]RRQ25296.1 maleylpyruvate isomerase family mycothiol-dependent enzyme [Rhodococcus sp. Eu-32]
MAHYMALASAERSDFADLLEGLTSEQWSSPSLCSGWSVKDVAAHTISFDVLDRRGLIQRYVEARFAPARINQLGVDSLASSQPDELVEVFRRHERPTGLTAGFGGRIALVDGLIHQQDVRRPLGLHRIIDSDRLLVALRFALYAPPIRGAVRLRGLALSATDLDWSHGRGPTVRGPAEALLMAMTGRRHATADLHGPGLATLASRCH